MAEWKHNGQCVTVLQKSRSNKDNEEIYYELIDARNYLGTPLGELLTKDRVQLLINSGVMVDVKKIFAPTIIGAGCQSLNDQDDEHTD